jgi:hypothetical protein
MNRKELRNMKEIRLTIIALAILLLSSTFVAAGGVCSLGWSTKGLEIGGSSNSSFVNLFTPPTQGNVTLDLGLAPGVAVVSGNNPQDNIAFANTAVWTLMVNSPGQKIINATMVNASDGSFICGNSTSYTFVYPPNVSVNLSSIPVILILNVPFDFSTTLFNEGPGNATNIRGIWTSGSGSTLSPATISASRINAGSSSVSSHSITPLYCGSGDSIRLTLSYMDENNVLMAPVTVSRSFNVVGSDVAFTTLSASPNPVNAGATTTFSARVENIGSMDAQNVQVTFYVDGSAVGISSLGNIAVGNISTATHVYTAGSGGAHNLSVGISANSECSNTNNNARTTFSVVGSAPYCGDGSCNNGETCSSCSSDCGVCTSGGGDGGGSSRGGGGGGGGKGFGKVYILTLTPENPSVSLYLTTGDTVKYVHKGEEYSFVFRYVYNDKVTMGVAQERSYKEYTLDEYKKYNLNLDEEIKGDLGITPSNLVRGAGNFTFELLDVTKTKPIITVPAKKTAKRTVEVEDGSKPAEPSSKEDAETEENNAYSEGTLEFVESLSDKDSVPFWAGLTLAGLVALVGLGLYYLAHRQRETA